MVSNSVELIKLFCLSVNVIWVPYLSATTSYVVTTLVDLLMSTRHNVFIPSIREWGLRTQQRRFSLVFPWFEYCCLSSTCVWLIILFNLCVYIYPLFDSVHCMFVFCFFGRMLFFCGFPSALYLACLLKELLFTRILFTTPLSSFTLTSITSISSDQSFFLFFYEYQSTTTTSLHNCYTFLLSMILMVSMWFISFSEKKKKKMYSSCKARNTFHTIWVLHSQFSSFFCLSFPPTVWSHLMFVCR